MCFEAPQRREAREVLRTSACAYCVGVRVLRGRAHWELAVWELGVEELGVEELGVEELGIRLYMAGQGGPKTLPAASR